MDQGEWKTAGRRDEGFSGVWIREKGFEVVRGVDTEPRVGETAQVAGGEELTLAEVS